MVYESSNHESNPDPEIKEFKMLEKLTQKELGSKPNNSSMENDYNNYLDFQSQNLVLVSSHQDISMKDLCIDDSKNFEPKILG